MLTNEQSIHIRENEIIYQFCLLPMAFLRVVEQRYDTIFETFFQTLQLASNLYVQGNIASYATMATKGAMGVIFPQDMEQVVPSSNTHNWGCTKKRSKFTVT